MDWYNYSGDLSNIQSLKVIKPVLEEKEAIEIFNLFREAKQLHPSITSWQRAWNKIAERQLLIEYVYLLTHGEMLSERIASQISEIGQSSSGKAKCEILRKVCFADLCGVRLSAIKLSASQSEDSGSDFGELLKGMESEFLVHVNEESGYIEGLHPIRSKHVVKRLHEFLPIDNTAISVMKMADKAVLSILFSHLPEFTLNKETFFRDAVESLWDEKDLSNYTSAIQGLFSGSVMQYFLSNRAAFDDADAHGGLFLLSTEMCPFAVFEDFGESMHTLDKMRATFPENKNIESEKIRKIVRNVLLKVGLWSKRKSSPMKLSGGQKQKLAIADALASNPGCLVLDDPTAMLDPASRKEVIKIAHELNQKEKMTIVLITHHTDEVVDAYRIILMKEGKFFYTGTSDEIILSMDMFVWNCIIPKSELNNYMKKYLIGNVRTVSDGVELRVLSKMPPTGNAVQVEATLEDAFLLYFGEKAGDKDDVQI